MTDRDPAIAVFHCYLAAASYGLAGGEITPVTVGVI